MSEAIIHVEDLCKSYGSTSVLKGIAFDAFPGQIIGYIGPNGAGKSTTVKVMTGMLGDFTGQVRVCGIDVARDPVEVKRRIGYVPETAALFVQLSPLEFMHFVGQMRGLEAEVTQRRSVELLTLFGLEAELNNRMAGFSKGMKQKVLLTSALLHDPAVIFLDEPMSGLDANSVVLFKEIMTKLADAGKTIFYCSHVMDVVERVCDRIIIISDGRVIADGAFDELRERSNEATLERIFTQLTGGGEVTQVAGRFVSALRGGEAP
jgi:ABC-2 type transport system ATP-binding protein